MLLERLSSELGHRANDGLERCRRIAESPCAAHQSFAFDAQHMSEGDLSSRKPTLGFGSNDYLGLANHPEVVAAYADGAKRYGGGGGSSHLVGGHSRAHEELETRLAGLLTKQIPDVNALFFSSGYMANVSVLTALGDRSSAIFADKLNHASLIDGALLARAKSHRYPHGQLHVLRNQLSESDSQVKLIVTDAVFSMDGDVADIPSLLKLAKEFDAWLVVDDAHGFGVLGENGKGSLSHFGLYSERFIYIGTLGKAAGVAGAFVAAHRIVIDWLMQTARGYIYTTATPPAVPHALCVSLDVLAGDEGEKRRCHLKDIIHATREGIEGIVRAHPHLHWSLGDSLTAIQPLLIGDNRETLAVASRMQNRGIWTPAIRPPTVPAGTARLRISLSAAHSMSDVEELISGLSKVAREHVQ